MYKASFINFIIGIAALAEIALCAIMLATVYKNSSFGPGIEICYNSSDYVYRAWIGPTIALGIALSGILIGIAYDLAMFRFLRRRRLLQVQPLQPSLALVPWSQGQNRDGEPAQAHPEPGHVRDNYQHPLPQGHHGGQPPLVSQAFKANDAYAKATIPIQATALGIFNLILMGLLVYILAYGIGLSKFTVYLGISCSSTSVVIHLPLVLMLTVKSQGKKKNAVNPVQVCPPSGLHFHEPASMERSEANQVGAQVQETSF